MKLFKLDNLSILALSGEHSADYLQGQLSCDIRQVSNTSIQQGALCNLKGRVLSLMEIINWDGYKLVVPKDLTEDTQRSLEKTALLSRVTLSINQDISVFGLEYKNTTEFGPYALPPSHLGCLQYENLAIANLGKGQYMLFIHSDKVLQLLASMPSHLQQDTAIAWHTLRLQTGYCSIDAKSRGNFLPHRLNLHKLGYLSFNKGCYRGQEVIARMHYRATAKHELVIQEINRSFEPTIGSKIVDAEKREMGELVDCSPLETGQFVIAASLLIERPATLYFEGENAPIEVL